MHYYISIHVNRSRDHACRGKPISIFLDFEIKQGSQLNLILSATWLKISQL